MQPTDHAYWIRLSIFGSAFIALVIWEIFRPKRKLIFLRIRRWPVNISLIVISIILIGFLFLTGAIAIAAVVQQNQWGLLYHFWDLPFWLHCVIALVLLDLSIYFQHVMFHALPLLWRFHRVHHADKDCDVTTGIRFHPIEMVLSLLVKFMSIAAIGAPIIAVLIFEIVLNATSMFTHSNIRLTSRLDHRIRWLFVTPDMHRIHHSAETHEMNSNFGFNFSIWDRLFGTYIKHPSLGHHNMVIGLNHFREAKWESLRGLMYMPFITNVPNHLVGTNEQTSKQDSENDPD